MISESLTPGQSGVLVVLGERRNRSQGGSDERKLPTFVKGRGLMVFGESLYCTGKTLVRIYLPGVLCLWWGCV